MNQTIAQILTGGAVEYLDFDFEERKRRLQGMPMNRDVTKENLILLKSIFDRHNITFWLMFGTCLGAVREGGFIEHDHDTDIGVLLNDRSKVVAAFKDLVENGLKPIRTLPPDTILSLMRKDEYIDLYFYTRKTDEFGMPYWTCLREFDRIYGDHLDRFDKIEFIGAEFRIPHDVEKLLAIQYGRNWRVPIIDRSNAICTSMREYHQMMGNGMRDLIDLQRLFAGLSRYAILQKPDGFPKYLQCDTIPVICENRKDFADQIKIYLDSMQPNELKALIEQRGPEWRLDFVSSANNEPELRLEIRQDFSDFRQVYVDGRFIRLLLRDRPEFEEEAPVQIVTHAEELAYRIFEIAEFIQSDPVRAENHRRHVYHHINTSRDEAFLKLVTEFSDLRASIGELNGTRILELKKGISPMKNSMTGDNPAFARLLRPNILALIGNSQCQTKRMHPLDLLTAERFDLTAKTIYASHQRLKIQSDWASRLYAAHLNVFNGCIEPDGTGKNSLNAFLRAFQSTLESIEVDGFDPNRSLIPVGRENVLLDGAHRVAAAILSNREIDVLCCNLQAYIYDYEFFKNYNRHVATGLAEKWTDAMAIEYCRLKKNTYLVSVFPSAQGEDSRIQDVLKSCGKILYAKRVVLENHGPEILMRQMYSGEPWLGDAKNGFAGAVEKARLCFNRPGAIRIYLLEPDDAAAVTRAKETIRTIFNIGNHSVHINDTHAETMRLANIFFNDNSLHFLNNARERHFEGFHRLFVEYQHWLKTQDSSFFCIDGSAVLAIYGLREARDLDFLHFGEETIDTGHPLIASHNNEDKHHVTHRDDIIFNPENHFYYQGLKFASLDIVRAMKEKRREPKDIEDVALINGIGKNVPDGLPRHVVSAKEGKLINIVYVHTRASGFAMHKGDLTVVWSVAPVEGCALYAFQDAVSFYGKQPGINVLLMNEPIVVLPGQYEPQLLSQFDFIVTSLESLAGKASNVIHCRHPVFDGPLDQGTQKKIDTRYTIPFEQKAKAICMISGNKGSHVPGELYSKRVEIAQWFGLHSKIPFDVYGRPAFPNLGNYVGELPSQEEKFQTLSRYMFSVCFENVYDPFWSRGYLTEKLVHCLMCGTIPIYLGCANIEDYVPRECFIDYRRFASVSELESYLIGLSDSDCQTYLDSIASWVRAGNLSAFSVYHTYDQLARLADPHYERRHEIDSEWQTGPGQSYAGRQLRLVGGSPRWSWNEVANRMPGKVTLSGNFSLMRSVSNGPIGKTEVKAAMNGRRLLALNHLKSEDWSLKVEFLEYLKNCFDVQTFIETGTYLGATTSKAAGIFPSVHTIELSPDFYKAAAQKFAASHNVEVHRGDSVDVLRKILPGMDGRILFWLDAHYSGDKTARGNHQTPILAELEAIRDSGITDGVILIDDIRYFQIPKCQIDPDSGAFGYPDLKLVLEAVHNIDGDYGFYILGDVAIACPPDVAVDASPVVRACTESRLFDDNECVSGALFESERIIAAAGGKEMEALSALANKFPSESQGVGYHYLLWLGLMLLHNGEYLLASRVLSKAIRCGSRHWRVGWYLSQAINRLNSMDQFPDELRDISGQTPYCPPLDRADAGRGPEDSCPDLAGGVSSNGLTALIFSKDRALQLDGTLRSFLVRCNDVENMDIKVLYKATNEFHEREYGDLSADYAEVAFIRENDFRSQVMGIVGASRHVLFLVDDNIFVRDFSIQQAVHALEQTPEAIGFSLRLGRNITHRILPERRRWKAPDLRVQSEGILQCAWGEGDKDMGFGYPLEVSSSLYRSDDLQSLLNDRAFSNPNTLESVLDSRKETCRDRLKDLLCFEYSVAFCNPINLVQTAWVNYAGQEAENSAESLAAKYADGFRLDPNEYYGLFPRAYHQEVGLSFMRTFSETQPLHTQQEDLNTGLISIIILNHNGGDQVRLCLDSIRACATEPYEMIVVDNASTDGSLEYLRTLKDITLVENSENLGCPPARTQAFSLARGDYVLLLDNDTIVTPGWLTAFCEHAWRNPSIGLFGPCSNNVSGLQKIDDATYEDTAGMEAFARMVADRNRGQLILVPRLVGFCMFIRRTVIDRIGAPDPSFGKFGFEDDDYTWRAIIAGFQAAIAKDIFIHHIGGPQMKGDSLYNRYIQEAWKIFKAKWELPRDLEYGRPFDVSDLLAQPFDKKKHFIPIPETSSIEDRITRPVDLAAAALPSRLHENLSQRLAQGEEQFAAGNLQMAEAIFTRVLADFPGQAEAHNNLGVLYYALNEKTKAFHHYRKAVLFCPQNVTFQKNLADFRYVEMGQVDLARDVYLKLLDKYPQDPELLLTLGRICAESGQTDLSIAYFARFLEVDGSLKAGDRVIEHATSLSRAKASERKGMIYCVGDSHVCFFSGKDQMTACWPSPVEDVLPFFKTLRLGPVLAYNLLETNTRTGGRQRLFEVLKAVPKKAVVLLCFGEIDCRAHLLKQSQAQNTPLDTVVSSCARRYVTVVMEIKSLGYHPVIWNVIPPTVREDLDTAEYPTYGTYGERMAVTRLFNKELSTLAEERQIPFVSLFEELLDANGRPDPEYFVDGLHLSQRAMPATIRKLLPLVASIYSAPICNHSGIEDGRVQALVHENRDLVSILVLVSDQPHHLNECVQSLVSYTEGAFEILLLSTDVGQGHPSILEGVVNQHDMCRLIRCKDENVLNEGIEAATGNRFVIIRDDVRVSKGWYTSLARPLPIIPDPGAGVIGVMANGATGIQKDRSGHYDSADRFDEYAMSYMKEFQHRRIPVKSLSNICIFFKDMLLERIGLFDEALAKPGPMIEDFCMRAGLQGFQNVIAGDVVVHCFSNHESGVGAEELRLRKFGAKRRYVQRKGASNFDLFIMDLMERVEEMAYSGNVDKAVNEVIQAIGRHPDARVLYRKLARILLDAGRFQDALEAMESMRADRDALSKEDLVLIGSCLENVDRIDDAFKLCEQALKLDPNNAPAWNLRGVLAYRREDIQTAKTCFARAIEIDPGYGEPYTNLGLLELGSGDAEKGLALLERGFILAPTAAAAVEHFTAAMIECNALERAEKLFRDTLPLYPVCRDLRQRLVDLLLRQNKFESALEVICDVLVVFGLEDDLLQAGIKIRAKCGPLDTKASASGCPSLSLCMIVKNEEEHLARCLASIKPVVAEIIIVDTGSTDRTRDIATLFGAKVFEFPWNGNFADARNVSLSKASGDWILVLDADEVVSTADHQKLRELIHQKVQGPVAYSIITRNYVHPMNVPQWVANDGIYDKEEAGTGWYPSPKIRLFTNDSRMRFHGRVHELVEPSLKEIGIKSMPCSIPVHHYGKLSDEKNRSKGEDYYLLGKRKIEEGGGDINALIELAKQASELKRYDEAIELWQKVIGLQDDLPIAHLNLSNAYMEVGNYQAGLEASKKAVNLDSSLKEAALNYATCALCVGNPEHVVKVLEGFLKEVPDHPVGMALLSVACCLVDDKGRGFEMMERLKNMGFECTNYLNELADRLSSANRIDSAILVLEAAEESGNATDGMLATLEDLKRQGAVDGV